MKMTFQHPIYITNGNSKDARILWTSARHKTESRKVARAVADALRDEPEALTMATAEFPWSESGLIIDVPLRGYWTRQGKLFTVADAELTDRELVRAIQDDVTAIHEAAHAVLNWDHDVEVRSLHIYADAESTGIAGECIIRNCPAEIEIGKLLPGVVAGELAEHFYVGRVPQFSLDLLKTGDYEQAFQYASMEYRSLRTTKRYDIETRQLIDPPNFPDEGEETEVLKLIQKCMVDTYLNLGSRWWPLITAVADELKRRRSLSGSEFYAVIGEYHQRKRRKAA